METRTNQAIQTHHSQEAAAPAVTAGITEPQPARATAATSDSAPTERQAVLTNGSARATVGTMVPNMKPEELVESIVTGLHQIVMIDGLRRGYLPDQAPTEAKAAIEWMNVKHFVVREAGKTVVITEEHEPVLDRRVLKRSLFEDIRNFYCNQFVDAVDAKGKPTKKPLGSYWLIDGRRRQYKGIICAPNGDTPGYYNLWKGFSVSPRPGDWSLMDAHIRENICAGKSELYRYVRKWLAFAVQHPDQLPEVALVLRGKQGTGKGVFTRGFGALFGQHFLHLARARHLVGNFNAHLRDAVMVFADEAFLADDKEAEGVLKAMITEPELTIERKFQDVVQSRNLIHLIVASNSERIIQAAPEERRFCVLDVGERRMQDYVYFAAILQQMEKGGREAMLHDLQHEDLSNFNLRQIPMTAALQDQKFHSMSPVEKWWLDKLQEGRLLADVEGWRTEVVREELLQDYTTATRQHWSSQELRNQLVKLLPPAYPQEGPRPSVDGDRKRTWVFPSLVECRGHFDKLFKADREWPEDPR